MQIGADPNLGYIDSNFYVPKSLVNVAGVKNALTFVYFTGKDREATSLTLYQETEHHLVVPREYWQEGMFDFQLIDYRPQTYKRVMIRSRIQLDHKRLNDNSLVPTGEYVQEEALNAMLNARGGILQLACGRGKTVIALEAMSRLSMPTIIVVDNMQLLTQWRNSIEEFLDVPGGVGLVGDGVFDWEGKSVVLATYQTLAQQREQLTEEFRRWFGVAIFDEAHHVNAPTFSRSTDLFYNRRYGLTATPERNDGLHVIHQFNFGECFYKDLTQDLKPRIYFYWTGFALDENDPDVIAGTRTKSGELNLSMLATWFGQWRDRLAFIIKEVRKAYDQGRKILVLSNSVDELVNLLAMWNGETFLYTDLPTPDLLPGEPPPARISMEDEETLLKDLKDLLAEMPTLPDRSKGKAMKKMEDIEFTLEQLRVARRIDKLMNKSQKKYREELLAMTSDAGLMIHKVPAEDRMRMLKEKRITFAIAKYGKEGLDDKALDTAFLLEPTSSRNVLQQMMGRIQRYKEGKGAPVFTVFEDNIRPVINMCNAMRRHLRKWPVSEGGPYSYEFVGYPQSARKAR